MARNDGIRVSVADTRMMRQGDQRQVPYQWVLRAIGAELDARGASQIMLLEGQDGFWVRFRRRPGWVVSRGFRQGRRGWR